MAIKYIYHLWMCEIKKATGKVYFCTEKMTIIDVYTL